MYSGTIAAGGAGYDDENYFKNPNRVDDNLTVDYGFDQRWLGYKSFEFGNHLGNVLEALGDRRIGVSSDNIAVNNYTGSVMGYSDYYPFGSKVNKRNFNSKTYRYGFQGQEKDDKINGNGINYNAKFWHYDSRLGRRWNTDPVIRHNLSPYATFSNNPILNVDFLGNSDSTFQHTVVKGETLGKLAKKYSTTEDNLRLDNPQTQNRGQADQINIGEKLTINVFTSQSDINDLIDSEGMKHEGPVDINAINNKIKANKKWSDLSLSEQTKKIFENKSQASTSNDIFPWAKVPASIGGVTTYMTSKEIFEHNNSVSEFKQNEILIDRSNIPVLIPPPPAVPIKPIQSPIMTQLNIRQELDRLYDEKGRIMQYIAGQLFKAAGGGTGRSSSGRNGLNPNSNLPGARTNANDHYNNFNSWVKIINKIEMYENILKRKK